MNKKQLGVSQRAYARIAGVRPSYIQKLVAEGKLPVLPDGTLDPAACEAARQRNTTILGLNSSDAAAYRKALTERAQLQAAMLKRDLDERDKKLCTREEVFDLWAKTAMILKTNLRFLPTKLAVQLANETRPAFIQQMLLNEIDQALTTIAHGMSEHPFFTRKEVHDATETAD
jgi:hypothetical protein